jgi:sarcosine oxidase
MAVPDQQDRLDVAVVGAGIIGVMAAWQLADRGHRVTVYDQWNTPNDRGASAGESRIFRTAYKEGADYVPLMQKSLPLWEELQAERDVPVLEMCGGLTIGPREHDDVQAVIDCAQSLDLEHEVLDRAAMAERFPQFGLDEGEVGVYDPVAGIFRPELAVLAAREESKRLGAVYRPYTKVLNVRSTADGIAVDTAEDAARFDRVVVATGPWATELAAQVGLDPELIQARRLVAGWFPARDVPQHQPENMPISIRRHPEAGFSCFPILDGTAVKILPHHLDWVDIDSPEELPRLVEPGFVRAIERSVDRLMPGLDPTAVRVSTWTEGFTPDGAPIVGPAPVDDRIILAVGMSGQGFKFAPAIGGIITDYVSDNQSADAIDIMSPRRFEKE